ncbi:peptidase [Vibrio kanaloae]|uniref:CBASS system CD-NTase/cGAS isopeptidase Cap3 n=1 Tax=Vibrio kanaloae TaxID=170673 RepID=UPI00148D3532|nr:peptidase [Vibrio kanaloae]
MTDDYCEVVFEDEEGQLVVFTEYVVKKLYQFRQLDGLSLEGAGVLIGERRGSHLVICDLSIPGDGDCRSRHEVNRKGLHHQKKVDTCFRSSGGFQQYLGEWHSHPEDFPTPSFKDEQSWKHNLVALKPMVIVIVGRRKLWVGKKFQDRIYPINIKK